jgi:hypothetical protein
MYSQILFGSSLRWQSFDEQRVAGAAIRSCGWPGDADRLRPRRSMHGSYGQITTDLCISRGVEPFTQVLHRSGFASDPESLIRSLENAFRALGGVPKIVVFDNAASAVKHADWYDPELNPKIVAFCNHYGFALVPTRPRTPEHKGKVERGVDYVQENALKGKMFESFSLQNQYLFEWERNVADTRIHGTIKKHVGKQFLEVEKQHLGPLPSEPFPIYDEGMRNVSRDGHVEVKGSFYSASPEYLGCEVWMRWNGRVVRMLNHLHEQIAVHPRMERKKFSTLSEHIAPAKINGIERGAQISPAESQVDRTSVHALGRGGYCLRSKQHELKQSHVITESRKEDYQASEKLDGCLIVRRKSKNRVRTCSQNHANPLTDCKFVPSGVHAH